MGQDLVASRSIGTRGCVGFSAAGHAGDGSARAFGGSLDTILRLVRRTPSKILHPKGFA